MANLLMAVLGISFFGLMFLGVPIAFAIGLSTFCSLLVFFPAGLVAEVIAQKLMTSLDSFGLLAIPFFVLAGNLMNNGGMARRLVDFAKLLAGRLPSPLLHCNIIANMLFGAISGSAVSAVAAVGGMMGPIQRDEGYDPARCAAYNIASGPTGLLIPPSGSLILYSLVSGGTSVAALFVAGYLPGMLMGLGLMLFAILGPREGRAPGQPDRRQALRITWRALPSLLLILIVIGGMIKGVFTATEASAVAVVYSLIMGLAYRELRPARLPGILLQTVRTTAMVLFLIGASVSMSWAMSIANIPELVAGLMQSVAGSAALFLLLLNVILLVVGTFMDLTPALLIFTPIFLPVATSLHIHPVHFGVMMVFNLCIGICTPPVGSALFVGCGIAKVPIARVMPHLLPLYAVLFGVLLLVTFVPALSLWLPGLMGLL